MENTIEKVGSKLKDPKVHLTLAVAIAAVTWLAPGDSSSYACPKDGTLDGRCIFQGGFQYCNWEFEPSLFDCRR